MNLNQSPLPSESQLRTHKNWLGFSILATFLLAGIELTALWMSGNRQIWTILVMLPAFIVVPIAYQFNRTDRQLPGSVILLGGINLKLILVALLQHDLSVMNAVTSLALAGILSLAILPREYYGRVIVSALVTFVIVLPIDLFGDAIQPASALNLGRWIFFVALLIGSAVLLNKQFISLDVRTKIVAGILGTGALALIIVIYFIVSQNEQVTNRLQARLETSVRELAEEQLLNDVSTHASDVNQIFEGVTKEVSGLGESWSLLQNQRQALNQKPYWDARTKLVQLEQGQYGNSTADPSSVFVPVGIPLDDALIKDLNVSAHLDFHAPEILRSHPYLLAVYAIDERGVTRYYPNVDLASLVSPNFNPATQRAYYKITAPLYNPQRQPRWAIPYVDAAGGGLVVTVTAPVYRGDQFKGIVAADMQLSGITDQIGSIKIGQTGYAFMIDDAGLIISMPQAGYDIFGIRPEDIQTEDFYKKTILGLGTTELQAVIKRMTAGGSGLLTVDVNGVDTYISYAPVKASGYSIALVVPVSELQGAIVAARNETQQQRQSASQTAGAILIGLLLVAVAISLGLGQLIAAPIQRLTQIATQIASGDLAAQADDRARDEIGTLARSFNTMTFRLRETLDGLEQMVAERTSELLSANEKNERRAKQFESIAKVTRTLSSTRDIDILLSQITTVISREFGFYHVGIFLLDEAKEYAILSAANSEGGQMMLQRGHRLKVGETGIVGYVTGTGSPRVALDTGADAVFFNNPDLPNTRSEIALPLRIGEDIMGALDVQSTEPGAFAQEDINILSTLADQVSIAIQNARQFEQTRKALNEAEALAKQFVQGGWQQFTKTRNLIGIHHTGARATLLYEKNDTQKEASVWDTDQTRKKSRGAHLSLPIELRGETIGSVDVRSPDNRPWDQDELDIVTAIIERAAIAMENARLLEESQRLASKEAKIGAVTAKISASINMRNVLQTAVEELGRALPGSEVVIQFQTDQNKNKLTS